MLACFLFSKGHRHLVLLFTPKTLSLCKVFYPSFTCPVSFDCHSDLILVKMLGDDSVVRDRLLSIKLSGHQWQCFSSREEGPGLTPTIGLFTKLLSQDLEPCPDCLVTGTTFDHTKISSEMMKFVQITFEEDRGPYGYNPQNVYDYKYSVIT